MPKLPDAPLERAVPKPPTVMADFIPARFSMPDASNAMGKAMIGVGIGAENLSKEWQDQVEKEQLEIDKTTALDGLNKAAAVKVEQTFGKDGYTQKRGQSATSSEFVDGYQKKWNDSVSEIEKGLQNDRQRQMFRQSIASETRHFTGSLYEHRANETKNWQKQVALTSVDQNINSAVAGMLNPDGSLNDGHIQSKLSEAQSTARDYAISQGANPNTPEGKIVLDAAAQGIAGKVYSDVIGNLIASNRWGDAENLFNRVKKELDPKDQQRLGTVVADGMSRELVGSNELKIQQTPTISGLRLIQKDVLANPSLSTNQKSHLNGMADQYIARIEHKQEVALNQIRTRVGNEMTRAYNNTLTNGLPPTPSQLDNWRRQAGNDPLLKPQFDELNATSSLIIEYESKDRAGQQAFLMRLSQDSKLNPEASEKFGKLNSYIKNVQEIRKTNPVRDLISNNIIDKTVPGASSVVSVIPSSDPKDPRKAAADDPNMTAITARVEALYGRRNMGYSMLPLDTGEVPIVADQYNRLGPEGRTLWQQKLSAALERVEGGREAYHAIMGQIAPHQPALALSGSLAARGGLQAATSMTRGAQMIADKTYVEPKNAKAEMERDFNDVVGNAYSHVPDVQKVVREGSLAIFAGTYKNNGEYDSRVYKDAVRAAMGGVSLDIHGQRVISPIKFGDKPATSSEFRDRLNRGAQLAINQGVAPGQDAGDIIHSRDYQFRNVSGPSGTYAITDREGNALPKRDKDGRPIMDSRGQVVPFTFNINDDNLPKPAVSVGGRASRAEVAKTFDDPGTDNRHDSTDKKGMGYYGPIKNSKGEIMTEVSIDVPVKGKMMQVPSLVPGLTKEEIEYLKKGYSLKEGASPIADSIARKAQEHAEKRIDEDLPVWARPGERVKRP